jgi:hypothetical protein
MGFYHILTTPINSAALDGQPDVPVPDGTADPVQAFERKQKFRKFLLDGFDSVPLDEFGGRWSKDKSQIIVETRSSYDTTKLPAFIQSMIVVANQTQDQILPYLAANSNLW